jgi:hypothetical protein
MSLTPFYVAFALPVGIIIVVNIVVFALVAFHLLKRSANAPRSTQSKRSEANVNFFAILSSFVILGMY